MRADDAKPAFGGRSHAELEGKDATVAHDVAPIPRPEPPLVGLRQRREARGAQPPRRLRDRVVRRRRRIDVAAEVPRRFVCHQPPPLASAQPVTAPVAALETSLAYLA